MTTDTNIPNSPNSITAIKTFGIPTSTMRYIVNNHFYIAETYKDCLDRYYLLQWDTSYFLSTMNNGMVTNKGIDYQVIYHKTDPCRIARKQGFTNVKLSFRIADPIFGLLPTVLVKVVDKFLQEETDNE